MGKKVFIPAVIAAVIIILTALYMVHVIESEASDREEMGKNISVDIDMIEDSAGSGDTDSILRAAERIRSYEYGAESDRQIKAVIIVAAFMIFTVFMTCLYLYIRVLRPFYELKDYAAELSKGNFDKPLKVSRGNYFGDFTWAFDNMRRELAKKREGEKTAIENNKTVISSLSHDIKTPIASIRAYAEAFEANMDSTPEKKEKYLRIIMEKCDEVTRLTNDLFLHSISEMNKLEVRNESLDIVDFIDNKVRSLYVDEKDVKIYSDFNMGAFLEFNGFNSYIDARPELYSKKINGKEDIYNEFIELSLLDNFDYNGFINKYSFKYLLTEDGSKLSFYLNYRKGYEKILTGNGYSLYRVCDYES